MLAFPISVVGGWEPDKPPLGQHALIVAGDIEPASCTHDAAYMYHVLTARGFYTDENVYY